MNLEFKIEELCKNEIFDLLIKSRNEFELLNNEELQKYSTKLSSFATFITCRDQEAILIGIIAFYANQAPNAYISHVWVSKEFRGKRICDMMLKELDNYLSENHFNIIRLEVFNDNISAIRAYSRSGFRYEESRGRKSLMKKYIQFPN